MDHAPREDHSDLTLRTPRLLLRCWQPQDAPLLKEALDSSLAHLQKWMDWAVHEPSTLAVLVERIESFRSGFEAAHDWTYAIFNDTQTKVIGGTGLHKRASPGTLEIGYWIRADSVGRGFATEAAAALTHFAFTHHNADSVEIRCDPNNEASAAVPRKLLFLHEETLPNAGLTPDGKARDTMVWSMTRARFSARQAGGNAL